MKTDLLCAAGADLELLRLRYGLSDGQDAQLRAVLGCLAAERQAPTTVREPASAVRVHLADSLAALELDVVREAKTIADLGAGAGFPGLPLAVALPGSRLRLVESNRRKCIFMEGASRAAGVQNVEVVCVRAEEWPAGISGHDLVLARALAPQTVVLEYAAPLLRDGGALVDWRGRRDPGGEVAAQSAAAELGLGLIDVRHVKPYAGARDHHLHVFVKVAPTPAGFPRRLGMARKRPLG